MMMVAKKRIAYVFQISDFHAQRLINHIYLSVCYTQILLIYAAFSFFFTGWIVEGYLASPSTRQSYSSFFKTQLFTQIQWSQLVSAIFSSSRAFLETKSQYIIDLYTKRTANTSSSSMYPSVQNFTNV
jgi:hypothetical protein